MALVKGHRGGPLRHELTAAVDAARVVAQEQVAEHAARVDRTRAFPSESCNALGACGALGLMVPENLGGHGGNLAALAGASEAIARSCASTAMVFLMHSVTAAMLSAAGGERTEDKLRAMARGETLGTLAFSERGTGAHFYAPELRAERQNGHLYVTGRKEFVTSGGHADVYLVLLQEEEGVFSAFIVERSSAGVQFLGEWRGLGMAGNSSIAMEFDGVQLEASARVGERGAGQDIVFSIVAPYFLVGLAAVNVGIASAAASTATEHCATRRYEGGGLLADVQYIQQSIADMDVSVRSTRLLVEHAAAMADAGDPGALVPIMEAKVAACEAAPAVTQQALEVCGGRGYTPALPIERNLRDARAGAVMAPTNAVLRTWIGKALAGLPVP
jgi:alkylation response protein AidB-like acyl-CoA dehydrogenase